MNTIDRRAIESLVPYARNSRTHSDEQVAMIAASLREFGWTNPILIDEQGGVIAGHGRLLAARKLQAAGSNIRDWPALDCVPVIELSGMTEAQKRAYIIADNKLAERAGWDAELLAVELNDLKSLDFDLDLLGFEADELTAALDFDFNAAAVEGGDGEYVEPVRTSLAERFGAVPFSVLSAREGWWVDRKRAWIALGLDSGAGRKDGMVFSYSSQPAEVYDLKNAYERKVGRIVTWPEFAEAHPEAMRMVGTSIFDPVLCEIAYRWFSPVGGLILDPFAGGSVRGVVAAKLGRQYVGVDLRPEQVEANREQWQQMAGADELAPVWHCGDSRLIDKHAAGVEADLVFSCPPYADLEAYSDDPQDISTLAYADFLAAYREIIAKSVALLKPDRFACFVVGEVRDKKGFYYNFVGDTVQAFVDAGAMFYNEAILVTQVGSLAVRAGKSFSSTRKLGKSHQNILVFCKGDPKRATEACGVVDVTVPEGMEAEEAEGGANGDAAAKYGEVV